MALQILRAFKRKFGIAAPRVAVRTHVPWYLRWLGIITLSTLIVGVGWATYDFGMEFAGFRQREAGHTPAKLNDTIARERGELAELRTQVVAVDRLLQIERATYGDLAKQVKSLTEENAALKEDLAFFQSLIPAGGREGAITVNRFRLLQEALPGEYRYRLLLIQTGQRVREFRGRLQLVLNLQQDGRQVVLMLPTEQDKNAKEYQLDFKSFQRIEGTFKIPSEALVKGIQVRVFERGSNAPRLTQTVDIS